MNITPHATNIPLATVVNQPTENLRRDNNQRDIITQVVAPNPSSADKGVASEKDRARTPAQANEQVDFANLRKQAEQATSSINDQENPQSDQQSNNKDQNEQANTNTTNPTNSISETDDYQNNKVIENTKEEAADARMIAQLQQRDAEVRAHELAHASTGGAMTGAPSYSFQVGPDGKKYAVGGEVSVDLNVVAGDPKATIAKMQKVHAAALAPANPSAQDIRVAASATQKILAAQSELLSLDKDKGPKSSYINNDRSISTDSTLDTDAKGYESKEFDSFINQTLSAQESITASTNKDISPVNMNNLQSNEVIQRALRIESYYFNVSQGYEKPENFQFKLMA